jgi:hypothetical protein
MKQCWSAIADIRRVTARNFSEFGLFARCGAAAKVPAILCPGVTILVT